MAALLPTLAIAQQRPTTPPANQPRPAATPAQQPAARPAQQPAARPATPPPAPAARPAMTSSARSEAWEISVQAGMFSVDKNLGGIIGQTASPSQFLVGGQASLAKHINNHIGIGVGVGFGSGSNSLTTIRPTADITWTSDINKDFSIFIPVGVGLDRLSGANSARATSTYGVYAGLGIRKFLNEGTALRVEGRMSYDNFSESAIGSTFNGAGLIGLSFFPSGRKTVASVVVNPRTVMLAALGQTQQLTAAARDASGNALAGRVITWSSNNASVRVSATGLVTAVSDGGAVVTATSEGVGGTTSVTVSRSAASLTVAPATGTLAALGLTQQFTAAAKDANNNAIANAAITWSSSAPNVATVSPSGMATAVGNGMARITATASGRTATATLTVAQATASVAVTPATHSAMVGATAQFEAQASDAGSRPIMGKAVMWSSDAPAVATVSPTGLATGVSAGTAHITASADGRTGSAVLTVTQPPRGAPALAPLPSIGQSMVLRGVAFVGTTARLAPASNAVLEGIADAIKAAAGARFEVGAYSDNRGVPAAIQRRTDQQAAAVVAFLTSHGVPASAITAHGYGSSNTKAPNTTAAGRAQNRRIELKRAS
ncbi:MAG: Ig-like domain-containing protein [Gemmatimonadales bacterium]